MKRTVKVSLIVVFLLSLGTLVKAQEKTGYINLAQVLSLMPESKGIPAQIENSKKPFSDQMTTMSAALEAKANDLQQRRSTLTESARQAAETDLQGQGKRFRDYESSAHQSLMAKEAAMTKLAMDKLRAAVTEVALEKGFSFVIDTSQTNLVVAPAANDLTEAVKSKLGI